MEFAVGKVWRGRDDGHVVPFLNPKLGALVDMGRGGAGLGQKVIGKEQDSHESAGVRQKHSVDRGRQRRIEPAVQSQIRHARAKTRMIGRRLDPPTDVAIEFDA